MLSLFIFMVVVDVVTELARWGVLSEELYVGDLVLKSGTCEGHMLKNWKTACKRNLEVSFGKATVIVS